MDRQPSFSICPTEFAQARDTGPDDPVSTFCTKVKRPILLLRNGSVKSNQTSRTKKAKERPLSCVFLMRASEAPTKPECQDAQVHKGPYLGKLTGQHSTNCVSCRHCSQQVVSRCSKWLFNSLEVTSYKKHSDMKYIPCCAGLYISLSSLDDEGTFRCCAASFVRSINLT